MALELAEVQSLLTAFVSVGKRAAAAVEVLVADETKVNLATLRDILAEIEGDVREIDGSIDDIIEADEDNGEC